MSPYLFSLTRKSLLPLWVVAFCVFAVLGCSIFPSTGTNTQMTAGRPMLPPIQAVPDAIQLELFFIERPAEDPLLSTGIWKEVDLIGALPSAEIRQTLKDNGFRVGNASSHPPASVQKLLGMISEIPANSAENARPLMGRHQFLAPGIETEIPTGHVHEHCDIQLYEGGDCKTVSYDQVNCVLRMKANRLQEGWVRIDFQPEIHYGENQIRRTAAEEEWSLRMGQNIDVRVAQRFSMTMNIGELALITATPSDEGLLGERFFCHEEQGMKKQRVLVVRINNAGQAPH